MTGKQLKNAILQLAIQGKLVPQDAADEPASALLARIRKEKEQLLKAGKLKPACRQAGKKDLETTPIADDEKPFEIPENWEWVNLIEICSFLSRGKSPSYSDAPTDYPVFAQKCNLKDGGISLEQARFLKPETIAKWQDVYHLKNDDVLVNSTGTGTVCRTRLFNESCLGKYPFAVPDSHVSVVRTVDDICSPYICYLFNTKIYQDYWEDRLAGSTNQKELYIGVLQNTIIPIPPLAEQHRIVSKIEELMPLVEEYGVAQEKLNRLNEALPEALKKSILQQAIQGKLVPPACRLAGKTRPTSQLPTEETGVWYVYVIECEDGSFYKGFTTNLQKRYKEHCSGRGAEWTKKHKPKQLYYYEIQYSEEAALKREKYLKSGSGREWFKREVVDKSDDWEPASALLAKIRKEKEQLLKAGKLKPACRQAGKKDLATTPITDEEKPFEIPESWEWCKLQDLCYLEDGIKSNEKGILLDAKYLRGKSSAEYVQGGKHVSKGDNIILVDGENSGEVFDVPVDGIMGSTFKQLIINSVLYKPYLLMQILFYKNLFRNSKKGAAIPHLNKEIFRNLPISLPPLSEQRRIVAKIEELMALVEGME